LLQEVSVRHRRPGNDLANGIKSSMSSFACRSTRTPKCHTVSEFSIVSKNYESSAISCGIGDSTCFRVPQNVWSGRL